ncbi:MAG: hypothetical protein ACR2OH_09785, partial [Microthrixaceae bacterium]
YLNGGVVAGERLLSEDWVDTARVATGTDADNRTHSAHWWIWQGGPTGAYNCSGYEGQYIIVCPSLDAVVVRLGQSETALRDNVAVELNELIRGLEQH